MTSKHVLLHLKPKVTLSGPIKTRMHQSMSLKRERPSAFTLEQAQHLARLAKGYLAAVFLDGHSVSEEVLQENSKHLQLIQDLEEALSASAIQEALDEYRRNSGHVDFLNSPYVDAAVFFEKDDMGLIHRVIHQAVYKHKGEWLDFLCTKAVEWGQAGETKLEYLLPYLRPPYQEGSTPKQWLAFRNTVRWFVGRGASKMAMACSQFRRTMECGSRQFWELVCEEKLVHEDVMFRDLELFKAVTSDAVFWYFERGIPIEWSDVAKGKTVAFRTMDVSVLQRFVHDHHIDVREWGKYGWCLHSDHSDLCQYFFRQGSSSSEHILFPSERSVFRCAQVFGHALPFTRRSIEG